jgi:hypothetical protein
MCQWNVGSTLPRDVNQITPCFRAQAGWDPGADTDWSNLAEDLATALQGWQNPTRGLTVKLYDIGQDATKANGKPPNRPKATATRNLGNCDESPHPRDIALCLSFNGGPNAKTNRGRIYVPIWAIQGSGQLAVRPTSGNRAVVGALPTIFANLGGANVDWIVWSRKANAATKVERWYVDDEWDTQRRRGLKSTARTSGTTSG